MEIDALAIIQAGKNSSRIRSPVSWLVESPGKPNNREQGDSIRRARTGNAPRESPDRLIA